jgi:hypothetical protein
MEFHWDDEQKTGILLWKGRTFMIEGYIDPFNARKRAEQMAEQRGWKRPRDKTPTNPGISSRKLRS